jgi:hypothetical protein
VRIGRLVVDAAALNRSAVATRNLSDDVSTRIAERCRFEGSRPVDPATSSGGVEDAIAEAVAARVRHHVTGAGGR